MIIKHDENKTTVTRSLQAQLDDKLEKIAKYEQKLADL